MKLIKKQYRREKKKWRKDNKEKVVSRSKKYNEARRGEHINKLKDVIEPNEDGKWIYIMKCGVYYKVGISNDPIKRVIEVESRTNSPTNIIYIAQANHGRTIDTESIIHHELSSLKIPMPYVNGKRKNHTSREWFFGSIDKIVEVVSKYAIIKMFKDTPNEVAK